MSSIRSLRSEIGGLQLAHKLININQCSKMDVKQTSQTNVILNLLITCLIAYNENTICWLCDLKHQMMNTQKFKTCVDLFHLISIYTNFKSWYFHVTKLIALVCCLFFDPVIFSLKHFPSPFLIISFIRNCWSCFSWRKTSWCYNYER